jgi:hypothetical protein
LERQIARLVNLYPGAEVVGEIGGGLNFQRPRSLPYWNESVQEMSEQLWSLTGIDSAGLDLTSLRGIAVNTVARSWFSMINAPISPTGIG